MRFIITIFKWVAMALTCLAFGYLAGGLVAEANAATLEVAGIVPVYCQVLDNTVVCNLVLSRIDSNAWIDVERGYKVTLNSGILTIENLN